MCAPGSLHRVAHTLWRGLGMEGLKRQPDGERKGALLCAAKERRHGTNRCSCLLYGTQKSTLSGKAAVCWLLVPSVALDCSRSINHSQLFQYLKKPASFQEPKLPFKSMTWKRQGACLCAVSPSRCLFVCERCPFVCEARWLSVCGKVLFHVRQGSRSCARCLFMCSHGKPLFYKEFPGCPHPRCSFVCTRLKAPRPAGCTARGQRCPSMCSKHCRPSGNATIPPVPSLPPRVKVRLCVRLAPQPRQAGKPSIRMFAMQRCPFMCMPDQASGIGPRRLPS